MRFSPLRRSALALLALTLAAPVSPASAHHAPPAVAAVAPAAPGNPAPGTVQTFLERQLGVLKSYKDGKYTAAQIIEGYSAYYSLNPNVILVLLELEPHLLTDPNPDPALLRQPFGKHGPDGFALQLDWAIREIRAGFGPYSADPVLQFSDSSTVAVSRQQEPALVALQRFLAQGHTQTAWRDLVDGYLPLYRRFFGDEPLSATPTIAAPATTKGFLDLPWPRGTAVIHSSYFDHAYPTVDRGGDGNDFIVNHLGESNLSYNTHDGHDFYFPDQPIGTWMLAAAPGVAYAFTARGNGVVIRHSGAYAGYETVYWHLDQFDAKFESKIDNSQGVVVQAGEVLGTSGKSGFVQGGAHLHFEVRHNGKQVDPYGWYGGGDDPCAAWVAGCEASVWLWKDELRGSYDFTPPNTPTAPVVDNEPPVATLRVQTPNAERFLAQWDGQPVQNEGVGFPEITASKGATLRYVAGVRGEAVVVPPLVDLTYPISGNLTLDQGSLAVWAKLPETYPASKSQRHYLFAASETPADDENIYTNTLTLRHQIFDGVAAWNFWTVDHRGQRHDLVVSDTLTPGWHHFVVTWDRLKSHKQLWIDGLLAAEALEAALPSDVGTRLHVGRWTTGYGDIGTPLDELLVTSEVLNPAAIARLVDTSAALQPAPPVVTSRNVILDTNAIDAQGGIVSVQLRRDDEPWGTPLPYYDSYRWTITGTIGLHTFSALFRDRANNSSIVTTTVLLTSPPALEVSLGQSTAFSGTLAFSLTGGVAPWQMQISHTPDFAGAVWEPWAEERVWPWMLGGAPQVAYVRVRDANGLISETQMVGNALHRVWLPFVTK